MASLRVLILGVAVGLAASQGCTCSSDETCCDTSGEWFCCVDEVSMCVDKGAGFPARCCPKWTVGCATGSVGCCDPARPWQRFLTTTNEQTIDSNNTKTAVNNTMYAVFYSGLTIHLEVLQIAASGTVVRTDVTGPAKTWYTTLYQEGTRVFSFDARRDMFHFVDGSNKTTSTLYSINARDGTSTSTPLATTGYPIGYYYHYEKDLFIYSILQDDGVYQFYSTAIGSGTASKIGSISRGDGESDPAYYGGYITSMGLDGTTVQRVGYLNVITGGNSGMGTFNLTSTNGATTPAWTGLEAPEGCDFYYSVARVMGGDEIISLAPDVKPPHSFKVVRWTPGGGAKVVASLENAHSPDSLHIRLGYIAAHQAGSTFGAMVLQNHNSQHKWSVLTMDLPTNTATVKMLNPEFLISSGSGLSGFGVSIMA